MLGLTTTRDPGTSGMKNIAEALGGGIREGSLVIIEGEAKTGKSVLCQHIAYGVLTSKISPVCYITSDYSPKGLVAQMKTLNLDVARDVMTDRLRIYRRASSDFLKDAEPALQLILNTIIDLPER